MSQYGKNVVTFLFCLLQFCEKRCLHEHNISKRNTNDIITLCREDICNKHIGSTMCSCRSLVSPKIPEIKSCSTFLEGASYFTYGKSPLYFMFFWVYLRNKKNIDEFFRFLGFDDMLLTFSIIYLLIITCLHIIATIKI